MRNQLFVNSLTTIVPLMLGLCLVAPLCRGDEWRRFRGPDGAGVSEDRDLPTTWSDTENLLWKTELPGAGSSSPIVVGDRVFVTCYSGYGVQGGSGAMPALQRHLVCVNRIDGKLHWTKDYPGRAAGRCLDGLPDRARLREQHAGHGRHERVCVLRQKRCVGV